MPHPGHCLTRAIKDLFPRYRTMRGYLCERKAGWDTHGLPVEVEVCKELGIHSKEEIEAYGVEPFIHKCQESVWRYMQEWERLTERLGFWIDLDEAYVTYHQSYVESVWWSLKNLFDRGLLYQGHKIVWWWAQGGTALSAGEVGQGYREVADPSVYVRFPLVDDARQRRPTRRCSSGPPRPGRCRAISSRPCIRSWNTRPSSMSETGERADRGRGAGRDDRRQGQTRADGRIDVAKAASLIGRRYVPPFDYYYKSLGQQQRQAEERRRRARCLAGRRRRLRHDRQRHGRRPSGAGVRRSRLRRACWTSRRGSSTGEGPQLICAVGPDGKFTAEAPDYQGRWVKDGDKDIIRELKQRGLLYHQEQYLHEYPFCWRAEEDPLIQYPRRELVHPHDRSSRTRCSPTTSRSTGCRSTSSTAGSAISWSRTSIGPSRASATGARRCRSGSASRPARWKPSASYDELLAKPGVQGTEVWDAAKKAKPELPDDLEGPQAVHRRGHVRLAVRARARGCGACPK